MGGSVSSRKARRRIRDKSILMVLEKHKLQRLRFKEIRQGLKDIGHGTDDATITSNLKYLMKKNLVWKFDGGGYCLVEYAVTIEAHVFIKLMRGVLGECPIEDELIKIAKMSKETHKKEEFENAR